MGAQNILIDLMDAIPSFTSLLNPYLKAPGLIAGLRNLSRKRKVNSNHCWEPQQPKKAQVGLQESKKKKKSRVSKAFGLGQYTKHSESPAQNW